MRCSLLGSEALDPATLAPMRPCHAAQCAAAAPALHRNCAASLSAPCSASMPRSRSLVAPYLGGRAGSIAGLRRRRASAYFAGWPDQASMLAIGQLLPAPAQFVCRGASYVSLIVQQEAQLVRPLLCRVPLLCQAPQLLHRVCRQWAGMSGSWGAPASCGSTAPAAQTKSRRPAAH